MKRTKKIKLKESNGKTKLSFQKHSSTDLRGISHLHSLAILKDISILKVCDLFSYRDFEGKTPLHYLAGSLGPNPIFTPNENETARRLKTNSHTDEQIQVFVREYKNVDSILDNDGNSPLYYLKLGFESVKKDKFIWPNPPAVGIPNSEKITPQKPKKNSKVKKIADYSTDPSQFHHLALKKDHSIFACPNLGNIQDTLGRTPLHYIAARTQLEDEVLIGKIRRYPGVNLMIDSRGITPLTYLETLGSPKLKPGKTNLLKVSRLINEPRGTNWRNVINLISSHKNTASAYEYIEKLLLEEIEVGINKSKINATSKNTKLSLNPDNFQENIFWLG